MLHLVSLFSSYFSHDTRSEEPKACIMCVTNFSAVLSAIFLILRRTLRDTIKDSYWSSCIVPVIRVRLQCNSKFLDRFSTHFQISNSKLSTSCFTFKLVFPTNPLNPQFCKLSCSYRFSTPACFHARSLNQHAKWI